MSQQTIYIYTTVQSAAFDYALSYLFEQRLGLKIHQTADVNLIDDCLAYSDEPLQGIPSIYNSGFLQYTLAQLLELKMTDPLLIANGKGEAAKWFTTNKPSFLLDFDILSAIFLHLSRLEEYLISTRDEHDRFDTNDSILHHAAAFKYPLIDIWVQDFAKKIRDKFPNLTIKSDVFEVELTFDIDQAYAFKGKAIWRKIGGALLKLKAKGIQSFLKHIKRLSSNSDPFDTYDLINSIPFKTRYFFLMGNYGKYDKNLPASHPLQVQLIKHLAATEAQISLHPSYASNTDLSLLNIEKERLENILNSKIVASRQHYLKLKLPTTYNHLLNTGIKHDYTMGSFSQVGFRAATSRPFYWFDLLQMTETNLVIHPFCMMDVTLRKYLMLNTVQAKESIDEIIEIIAKYKGLFTPLWHNESLSQFDDWEAWKQVFLHMVKKVQQHL